MAFKPMMLRSARAALRSRSLPITSVTAPFAPSNCSFPGLWTRLYDGNIETHNLDVLTRIAPGQGIVYVPAHRSHIDYLLLSYLLHENGFPCHRILQVRT